jgi:hypothetical protein
VKGRHFLKSEGAAALFRSKNGLREKTDFASRFKAITTFNPLHQNISLYQK